MSQDQEKCPGWICLNVIRLSTPQLSVVVSSTGWVCRQEWNLRGPDDDLGSLPDVVDYDMGHATIRGQDIPQGILDLCTGIATGAEIYTLCLVAVASKSPCRQRTSICFEALFRSYRKWRERHGRTGSNSASVVRDLSGR